MSCAGRAPSGYYEWLTHRISNRGQEDARLLRLIRAPFAASEGIYGAPRVFLDLREAGVLLQQFEEERIKKQIYKNRELALNDVADYIDRFYNRTRRHSHLAGVSQSSSKRLRSDGDGVSTESWELQSA